MANGWYPLFLQALLTHAAPNLADAGTDVRVVLVDTALYTYNAAHDALADIPAGARVAVSPALSGKAASTAGVFDANDVTLPAVTGPTVEALALYYHTGTESTSLLIAYLDTGITGLPATPDGSDVVIGWNVAGILGL